MPDNNSVHKLGKHIIVKGLVQGVFYRAFTQERAQDCKLTGWTRNLSDGSVEVKAFGDEAQLSKFISELKQGPKASKVDNLNITTIEYDDIFIGFEIIATK